MHNNNDNSLTQIETFGSNRSRTTNEPPAQATCFA